MKFEKRYWAIKCPNCKRYQCKEAVIFGRTSEKATCIYCGHKILLGANGRTMDIQEAQSLVMRKNAEGNETLEFKTYRKKDNGTK